MEPVPLINPTCWPGLSACDPTKALPAPATPAVPENDHEGTAGAVISVCPVTRTGRLKVTVQKSRVSRTGPDGLDGRLVIESEEVLVPRLSVGIGLAVPRNVRVIPVDTWQAPTIAHARDPQMPIGIRHGEPRLCVPQPVVAIRLRLVHPPVPFRPSPYRGEADSHTWIWAPARV